MAHTNFPERTQRDSVSTALLSLKGQLNIQMKLNYLIKTFVFF
jgi:hypothetical protein